MKKLLTVLLLMVLASITANAQHDHNAHASASQEKAPAFKDENVTIAYNHYIHLKEALVSSNAEEAKKAAKELEQSLGTLANGKKAIQVANKISSSSDIKDQRKSFSPLSNEITNLVKGSKLTSGSIYLEYCPMANDNEGAFWLSNEKEIKNPYFGDAMLKCGSVKETLQ
jgi:hypothetical protein